MNKFRYGLEGELAVKEYFKHHGFEVEHHTVITPPHQRAYADEVKNKIKHGDLMLRFGDLTLGFDVIRGSLITKRSIDVFNGNFYILIPNGDLNALDDARVLWRKTVANYVTKATENWTNDKYIILGDGSTFKQFGYRLTRRLRRETSLANFMSLLTKVVLLSSSIPPIYLYKHLFFGEDKHEE